MTLRWWKRFSVATFVTAGALLCVATVSAQNAGEILAEGWRYVEARQYEDALTAFTQASELDPDNGYFRRAVGYVLYQFLERSDEALDHLLAADRVIGHEPWLSADLGFVFGNLENSAKAIEYFERAAVLYEEQQGVAPWWVHANLAWRSLYADAPDYEKSIHYGLRALELDVGDADRHDLRYWLSAAHYELGRYEEALSWAVRGGDDIAAERYGAYGWRLMEEERFAEALEAFESAVSFVSENGVYIRHVGYLQYMYFQRYDEALSALLIAEPLLIDYPWVYNDLGNVYLNVGEPRLALENYQRAGTVFEATGAEVPEWLPGNIQAAYSQLAASLVDGGRGHEALELLETAHREVPEQIWHLHQLVGTALSLQEIEASAHWLTEMARLSSRLPVTDSERHNHEVLLYLHMSSFISLYVREGHRDQAAAVLEGLRTYFASDALITHMIGVTVYHAGDPERGIRMVNDAYDRYVGGYPQFTLPVTIPPPLKGTYLTFGNSRPEAITHAGFNQYCYDFFGSNEQGHILPGSPWMIAESNDLYFGFGDPVYSPVHGVVEIVEGDYPDFAPRDEWNVEEGNWISIRDDAGRHYVFVHLKQHSVQVEAGDTVVPGQIIAELGNSSSTLPHLHFGVYSPDWVLSLPVHFSEFTVIERNGGSRRRVRNQIAPHNGVLVVDW